MHYLQPGRKTDLLDDSNSFIILLINFPGLSDEQYEEVFNHVDLDSLGIILDRTNMGVTYENKINIVLALFFLKGTELSYEQTAALMKDIEPEVAKALLNPHNQLPIEIKENIAKAFFSMNGANNFYLLFLDSLAHLERQRIIEARYPAFFKSPVYADIVVELQKYREAETIIDQKIINEILKPLHPIEGRPPVSAALENALSKRAIEYRRTNMAEIQMNLSNAANIAAIDLAVALVRDGENPYSILWV